MLKFEEIGDVETDTEGDMLPGVYSIPGVGFIVVFEHKQTLIVPHLEVGGTGVYTHADDIKPWVESKRLQLVEVLEDVEG